MAGSFKRFVGEAVVNTFNGLLSVDDVKILLVVSPSCISFFSKEFEVNELLPTPEIKTSN